MLQSSGCQEESMNTNTAEIRIGTSGYSYDDWREVFYPAGLPKGAMLEYYTRFFNTVEINATYYKIPSMETFRRFDEKTPEDFHFIIKTHQETTHRRVENAASLALLTEAAKPLAASGKLKGYLAQFPNSFKNTEAGRKYVRETRKLLGDHPLFVEFRHASWNKEPVARFLAENDIGYVNVDEPPLRGLLPPQEFVTNNLGYVRFHGRNEKDWWEGKGSARYDYSYGETELEGWLIRISSILGKAFKAYIFFNNHPGGKAVKNARQMIELIKQIA
jgi:uncharacterized protein YecE (DUF72 family)